MQIGAALQLLMGAGAALRPASHHDDRTCRPHCADLAPRWPHAEAGKEVLEA